MQYLLLIYHSESDWAKLTTEEQGSIYQEYRDLSQQLSAKGKFRSGDQLRPAATAKVVRVRDKKAAVTDGPFAETKEQLAGYFLVDAETWMKRLRLQLEYQALATDRLRSVK